MKNLSKDSLIALSIFAFGVASASDDPWAKLVEDYKSGKLSSWQIVDKDSSATQSKSTLKKTLNKGKGKVEEIFSNSDEDKSKKKGGLFGLFGGKKSENNEEASTSGTSDIKSDVKNLGKKAEGEVKRASDNVKNFVNDAKDDVEDFVDESDEYYSDIDESEEESKPGFFSRLFGIKSGEDDTLTESSDD